MSSFPLGYLHRFCPRKSKPFSTCVITVFAGERSSPRSLQKLLHEGLDFSFQLFFGSTGDDDVSSRRQGRGEGQLRRFVLQRFLRWLRGADLGVWLRSLTKMLAEPIQCLRELQVEIDEP